MKHAPQDEGNVGGSGDHSTQRHMVAHKPHPFTQQNYFLLYPSAAKALSKTWCVLRRGGKTDLKITEGGEFLKLAEFITKIM